MITSRVSNLLRNTRFLTNTTNHFQQNVRNSSHHWNYRVSISEAQQPKGLILCAELVAGFAWWWVLWHLWTEPGHVTGEFEYPDPTKWSDAELGIPEE